MAIQKGLTFACSRKRVMSHSEDNVIWVDFRLSKDIRSRQELSFADRMKAYSERTRSHVQASKSALEMIRQTLDQTNWNDGPSGSRQPPSA